MKRQPKRPAPQIVELTVTERQALLQRVERAGLSAEDLRLVRALFESYGYVSDLIEHKNITLRRLREILFGSSTEKTADLVGRGTTAPPDGSNTTTANSTDETANDTAANGTTANTPPRAAGHGRNGADDYPGAQRVRVPHESLRPGDRCPNCGRGTIYETARAGVLLRFLGQAPIQPTIYELQKLRCQLCGQIFTASEPAGVGSEKYDATVASMIGLLKYGSGLPFNRVEGLQGNLDVPLPASTQWDIVAAASATYQPVWEELLRQAAQGQVVYNDDTTVRILEKMGKRARAAAYEADQAEDDTADCDAPPRERKGLFTSGVVATSHGQRIALFFSGTRHAGENLAEVLRRRAAELPPPIQMCDALSRNRPPAFETILANCLAHARRQFKDHRDQFPDECRHVLETLELVYRNDALARQRQLTADERLRQHQVASGPPLDQLHAWLKRQSEEKLIEPNSGMGAAIEYLRKHWTKLTLFLREPGAPLDNNIVERALKKAILHRKNALFYKTQRGAAVGDLHMSLIHTCELCGANPFDYLTQLQRHAAAVAATPADWLPWNYQAALAPAAP